MPFARIYEEYEIRTMLQQSEISKSPTSTAKKKPKGHARSLHALSPSDVTMNLETKKRVGEGAATAANSLKGLEDRVNNAKSAKVESSAFATLIQQASAATQALNSPKGQEALRELDSKAPPSRLTLTVAMRPLESSYAPRAVGISTTHVRREDPADAKSAVKTITAATTAVILVLETRLQGTLHIQSCYPSDDTALVSGFV
jgi:hypothetical protein